VLHWNYS